MKQTVYLSDFRDSFMKIRPNNFTYSGLELLFEYLTEIEDSCDTEIELDVIALCCEFNEDIPSDIAREYDVDIEGLTDDDEIMEKVSSHLTDEGAFVGATDSTIVYSNF